jgi:hypothetical protein
MRPLLLLIALLLTPAVALSEMKQQIVQFEDGTSYSLSGDFQRGGLRNGSGPLKWQNGNWCLSV